MSELRTIRVTVDVTMTPNGILRPKGKHATDKMLAEGVTEMMSSQLLASIINADPWNEGTSQMYRIEAIVTAAP